MSCPSNNPNTVVIDVGPWGATHFCNNIAVNKGNDRIAFVEAPGQCVTLKYGSDNNDNWLSYMAIGVVSLFVGIVYGFGMGIRSKNNSQ
jgi:hypothetical protein